jgi:uncharacterized protein
LAGRSSGAATAEATDWPPFIRWQADGCVVDVAVVPNARRTEAVGLHDQALRIKLAAPPVDGAANEALVRWLADELDLARTRVELLRGASGRRKQLHAASADPTTVRAWLERLAPVLSGQSAPDGSA